MGSTWSKVLACNMMLNEVVDIKRRTECLKQMFISVLWIECELGGFYSSKHRNKIVDQNIGGSVGQF